MPAQPEVSRDLCAGLTPIHTDLEEPNAMRMLEDVIHLTLKKTP